MNVVGVHMNVTNYALFFTQVDIGYVYDEPGRLTTNHRSECYLLFVSTWQLLACES